jgi:hypothetical protein
MPPPFKPSTSWAISASGSLGGGKGKVGAGIICLTLFDVQSQQFIPLAMAGGSVGMGLPVGFDVSTFSPTFFTTSKPLSPSDFDGRVSVAGAGITIVAGGSLAYCTFWNVDHSPYWLDIGGVQAGVSGGVSAGIYFALTSLEKATKNNGCLITPGCDPMCGGSSPMPANRSVDRGMSGG